MHDGLGDLGNFNLCGKIRVSFRPYKNLPPMGIPSFRHLHGGILWEYSRIFIVSRMVTALHIFVRRGTHGVPMRSRAKVALVYWKP